jgi:hypothetical protein
VKYCILATIYSKHVHYLQYCSNPHNNLSSNLYDGLLLANPNGKSKKTLGGCAFWRAAANRWNSLPAKYENYRTLQLLKIGSRHFYSVERFSNFTNWLVLLHVYNYISLLLFYCSYVYNHVQVRSYGGVCVWGGGGGGGGGGCDTPQKFYSKLQSAGLLFQSADKNIFDK